MAAAASTLAQLMLLPTQEEQNDPHESRYLQERAAVAALKEAARKKQAEIREIGLSLLRSLLGKQQQLPFEGDRATETLLGELTEAEAFAIHENVLLHSLHLLKDSRTAPARKREIVMWIAAPLAETFDARKQVLSFQACALACGCNPQTMQEMLLVNILPKLGIDCS